MGRYLFPLGAMVMALVLFLMAWASGSTHAILVTHLHEGTCDDLGDQPIDLGELGYVTPLLDGAAATPAGSYDPVGPDGAFPTMLGHATVDRSLDDLVATPHAVEVHALDEHAGTEVTLACGAVGGVRGDGHLVFGLQSLPHDGVDTTGIAWLQANDGDTTTVRIFVAQGLAPGGYGADISTPVP